MEEVEVSTLFSPADMLACGGDAGVELLLPSEAAEEGHELPDESEEGGLTMRGSTS